MPQNETAADVFGIFGNVFETDKVFRSGAKLLLCGGTGGEGKSWAFRSEWTNCFAVGGAAGFGRNRATEKSLAKLTCGMQAV